MNEEKRVRYEAISEKITQLAGKYRWTRTLCNKITISTCG